MTDKPREVKSNAKINRIIERFRKRKQFAARLEKWLEQDKKELKEVMGNKPGDLIWEDRLILSLIEYEETRINADLLKSQFPDVYKEVSKKNKVQKILLK